MSDETKDGEAGGSVVSNWVTSTYGGWDGYMGRDHAQPPAEVQEEKKSQEQDDVEKLLARWDERLKRAKERPPGWKPPIERRWHLTWPHKLLWRWVMRILHSWDGYLFLWIIGFFALILWVWNDHHRTAMAILNEVGNLWHTATGMTMQVIGPIGINVEMHGLDRLCGPTVVDMAEWTFTLGAVGIVGCVLLFLLGSVFRKKKLRYFGWKTALFAVSGLILSVLGPLPILQIASLVEAALRVHGGR
jgi:hypothetical protein